MAINRRILYVDDLSNILANTAAGATARSELKQWCQAKGITGCKWYCAGLSPTGGSMTRLRAMIEDMRLNYGVNTHQYVRSGSADTYLPTPVNPPTAGENDYGRIGRNRVEPGGTTWSNRSDEAAANNNQKFFILDGTLNHRDSGDDLEDEFYNYPTAAAATAATRQTRFLNNWVPVLENLAAGLDSGGAVFPFNSRKNSGATAYLGWFNAGASSPLVAPTIIANLTRLDLHAYVTTEAAAFGYTRTRLQELADASAAYNANPANYFGVNQDVPRPNVSWRADTQKYDVLPLFSAETAFLGPIYDVNGGNRTFDQVFDTYLTNFQAWTWPNKNALKEPDGYVLFAYTQCRAARPSLVTP